VELKEILAQGPVLGGEVVDWIHTEAAANFVPPGRILELMLRRRIPTVGLAARSDSTKVSASISPTQSKVVLDLEQQRAADLLCNTTSTISLLRGATGSGKTEVYFELIAQTLALGKQVILLLPEISLTHEWKARFSARFGFVPHVWHSKISSKQKDGVWAWAANGNPGVVVGARSAIFLPCTNCGLILIDEEHDHSYKQECMPRYHAREVAVRRAMHTKSRVLLVSATPSFEAVAIAEQVVILGRHSQRGLATLHVQKAGRDPISVELRDAIMQNAARNHGALLLVNRRGYASYASCEECRKRIMCNSCSVALVWHKQGLCCHWCGHTKRWPEACTCGAKRWRPCGWGLERIYDWMVETCPSLRIECVSSDTPKVSEVLRSLQDGKLDLVIGTQLISQGHNLPNVTLVAMLDLPHSVDFRTQERLYQLLAQTRGRAGRGDVAGVAWWETDTTQNSLVRYLDDPDTFYRIEMESRRMARMPPFANLLAIIVGSRDPRVAQAISQSIGRWQPDRNTHDIVSDDVFERWGPSPAPISKIKHTYRWRILARGCTKHLEQFGWHALQFAKQDVLIEVDRNPYSFY
jgi:primosomal protein N' (replication factor Y)